MQSHATFALLFCKRISEFFAPLYQRFVFSLITDNSMRLRSLMMRNCFRADGSISWKRARREAYRLLKIGSTLLVVHGFFVGINAIGVWFVHHYIVLSESKTQRMISTLGTNPAAWERALDNEEFGLTEEEDDELKDQTALSPQTASGWQETFSSGWLLYLVLALWLIATYFFFVFWLCKSIITYYKKGLLARRERYFTRDISSIPAEKIIF